MSLTVKAVAAALKSGKVKLYNVSPHTFLNVSGPGRGTYCYRNRSAKKFHTLGDARYVTLDMARKRGLELDLKIAAGEVLKSPREAKRESKPAIVTFKDAAEKFLAAKASGWRNAKHAAQWGSTLKTYAFPVIGSKAVDAITTDDLLAILEPLWEAKKTETGSRVRGRIERVLRYGKTRGWRSGENPASWKDNLAETLAAPRKVRPVVHHRALDWRDVPAFVAKLKAERVGPSGSCLLFLILTACRSGEVRGARWNEIDFDARLWTIPASRMKAKRPHRVPLCDPAIAVLESMLPMRRDKDSLVFPAPHGGQLGDMSFSALLKRAKAPITAHGMRSCFRTWIDEATTFPAVLGEAALAHALGDATVVAYARGDMLSRRAELTTAWSSYVMGGAGDDVFALKRERS